MNQSIQEQLSVLMDGELGRDETRFLLKRIGGDVESAARWSRYHLARETLRRQAFGAPLAAGFADGVMARIEVEPGVAHVRRRHGATWMRWGAGGAIAASVAVASLMLTRPAVEEPSAGIAAAAPTPIRTGGPQGAPISAAPAAATLQSDFRPPLLAAPKAVDAAPVAFGNDFGQSIAIDPRLQTYLIRHYQSAGGVGQQAVVPYVLLGAPVREAAAPQAGTAPQNR